MASSEGKFYIGIGAILEHVSSGKILLLRRSSDAEFAASIWDDIGGRMKDFETPEETLRREVHEETGIQDINILKPIDVSHYYRGDRSVENQMIVINYWCQTTTKKVKMSLEHNDFKWVYPEEALILIEDSSLRYSIKRFIEEKKLQNNIKFSIRDH